MYTTVGTYSFYMTVCCPGWYQLFYTYDLPPDDGPRYARNM